MTSQGRGRPHGGQLLVCACVAAVLGLLSIVSAAGAAGPGQYSSPDWLPLRSPAKVGCVYSNCAGPYHGYWALDLLDPQQTGGDPVYAAGAGQVSVVSSTSGGCGGSGTPSNVLRVDHGSGVTTYYYHLASFTVANGAWVDAGTQIAVMGSTGYTDPCPTYHLHYEKRVNGTRVDPGPLKACHGATVVTYPNALGYGSWNAIPPESQTVYSDGVACGSPPPPPPPAKHPSTDVDGDGKGDVCFLTGVNGGTTGSGRLEVHCGLGGAFQGRVDQATPFGYINTQNSFPFSADVDGDGKSDVCFLTGVNGGTTGSGRLEVHCGLGGAFQGRVDQATPFGYINTQNTFPFSADVDGDGKSDVCFLTGVNGGTTGSGRLEVHCGLGGSFQGRVDQATPFGYLNTQNTFPFSADVDGDGKSDVCFLTGVNGGTTGSGRLEVHCGLGGSFQGRVDQATPFGYINTQTSWVTNHGPTAPLAPGNVTAVPADGSASVAFSAPWNGGNPITGYTVTASPGGIAASGVSSPIVVGGLANGTAYTFTVTANNGFGPGPASAPSPAVTPAAPPPAAATPGAGSDAGASGRTGKHDAGSSARRSRPKRRPRCVAHRRARRTLGQARAQRRRAHCRRRSPRPPPRRRRLSRELLEGFAPELLSRQVSRELAPATLGRG